MSYENRTKVPGDFLDPGDEPAYTEEEEFEILRDGGVVPARLADPKKARRYAAWLDAAVA